MSWKRGCVLHMTASGGELRAYLVEAGPEMLQTVFLFFNFLNAQESAKIGDSRDSWNVVCPWRAVTEAGSYQWRDAAARVVLCAGL